MSGRAKVLREWVGVVGVCLGVGVLALLAVGMVAFYFAAIVAVPVFAVVFAAKFAWGLL